MRKPLPDLLLWAKHLFVGPMVAMAPKHSYRDPDSIRTEYSRDVGEASLAQNGTWQTDQLLEMNDAFTAAMQSAGYAITTPSTTFGTQRPIVGYQRED